MCTCFARCQGHAARPLGAWQGAAPGSDRWHLKPCLPALRMCCRRCWKSRRAVRHATGAAKVPVESCAAVPPTPSTLPLPLLLSAGKPERRQADSRASHCVHYIYCRCTHLRDSTNNHAAFAASVSSSGCTLQSCFCKSRRGRPHPCIRSGTSGHPRSRTCSRCRMGGRNNTRE